MNEIDWNRKAQEALELVQQHLTEAHRGAVTWNAPSSLVLAFGIDDTPDGLVKKCEAAGLPIRAVAANEEAFVVLVHADDPDRLTDWMWESWWAKQGNPQKGDDAESARFYERTQRKVAADRLSRFMSGFENYWDQQNQG